MTAIYYFPCFIHLEYMTKIIDIKSLRLNLFPILDELNIIFNNSKIQK